MIDIVIVNWNSGILLTNLINSIDRYHSGIVHKVIIVDNGSSDDSLADCAPETFHDFGLIIIRNRSNRGFGAACNQGARESSAEVVLFLNPDCELYKDSLVAPAEYVDQLENRHVGIVGIQLVGEDGIVSHSCGRFPTLRMFVAHIFAMDRMKKFHRLNMHMTSWAHDVTSEVDHVIGAFFFVRRSVFVELGGFDERFFVYLEDLDFSWRARELGYVSIYLSGVQAFHAGGGTSRQVKARRLFYSMRSRLFYGFKHLPRLHAWLLVGLTLSVEPISRVLFALLCLNRVELANTIKAYGMLFRDLPRMMRSWMSI